MTPGKDTHALPEQPGASVQAGTAGKQKSVPRETFRASIGQGSAAGGAGQMSGTTGDPVIRYVVGPGRPQVMGRRGKFGTGDHMGKRPINYDIDLASFEEEY